ncbi:MAG: DASS family sodium-coupled anion symporter [Verrucomicrobiales bacterium]|nr:DASS family sodium-coupled anion symporter [Verrucomicrobiales bacterium]
MSTEEEDHTPREQRQSHAFHFPIPHLISRADTRAEYRRILGHLEFRSGLALLKFVLCLLAAAAIAFLPNYTDLAPAAQWTLAIVLFCGLLWMTEAIPAFAVALLAIGLQIMILGQPGGVMNPEGNPSAWQKFVQPWASPSMWLFFGGFILAKASSRTGLDRSLAGNLLRLAGSKPERVLLVAMGTTFVFSMFLSNTATAAMMLAILAPMLGSMKAVGAARAMIIGVAFSANLGGMGTIIGTPPNAIASGLLSNVYTIDFLKWMLFGLPPAIILMTGLWWVLSKKVRLASFQLQDPDAEQAPEHPGKHPDHAPRWQRWTVLAIFVATIGLWLSGSWHGIPTAVVSFLPIVLFSITGVIRAKDIRTLDWDILILLAGGLSLGVGVSESGLAEWIAGQLGSLDVAPWAMGLIFGMLTLLLSNFMSNTAASNILIPIGIAAGAASGGSVEAAAFAVPMALSASAAMCLPISTPPNAIAYASGRIRSKDFLLPGAIIGLIAVPLATFWCRLLLSWIG